MVKFLLLLGVIVAYIREIIQWVIQVAFELITPICGVHGLHNMFWFTHQQGKRTYTNNLESKATWCGCIHVFTVWETRCCACSAYAMN